MSRSLYLVIYDVSCPRRLRAVGRMVKAHKVAGQKSLAECWLSPGERDRLLRSLQAAIAPDGDRLHVFRLDPRQDPRLFGIAGTYRRGCFLVT